MVYQINFRYSLLIFFLFILCFFGINRFVGLSTSFIDNAIATVLYPFLRLQKRISKPIELWKQKRTRDAHLEELVETLGAEREQLLAKTIALQSQLDFVQETKELIQFQKRYKSYQKQLAQILLRQFSPQGHYYIVDKGSKHGIELDMIAVYKNCLIGRVAEVSPYHCKVLLVSDQSCKVAAFCAQSKTQGIYEGMNQEDVAALTHVSHLESLQENDLVISSGQGLIFPRGFGLGKINHFAVEGVHYLVRLIPLVDLQHLSYCYLMKKNKE